MSSPRSSGSTSSESGKLLAGAREGAGQRRCGDHWVHRSPVLLGQDNGRGHRRGSADVICHHKDSRALLDLLHVGRTLEMEVNVICGASQKADCKNLIRAIISCHHNVDRDGHRLIDHVEPLTVRDGLRMALWAPDLCDSAHENRRSDCEPFLQGHRRQVAAASIAVPSGTTGAVVVVGMGGADSTEASVQPARGQTTRAAARTMRWFLV